MITRRFLALLSLAAIAGPAAQAQDRPGKDRPDPAALREALMALEKESWDSLKDRNLAAMRRFLPEDAQLIFAGASYNKREMLEYMANYRLDTYEIEPSYGLRVISPHVAELIYRVTSRGAVRFDRTETTKVLATSLYVRRAGGWRSVLYQETPSNSPLRGRD
jgi:hypothetical protein